MAKISGVYANGLGEPVPGINLVLTARATSSGVIMTTTATQQTGAGGEYSFELLPGVYVVTASSAYLGVINVNPDSVDGTLNDYLTNFSADEMTPAALAEVQELVTAARNNAAAAAASADAAHTSEANSTNNANAAAAAAAAAQAAETNSANNAAAAAASAAAAGSGGGGSSSTSVYHDLFTSNKSVTLASGKSSVLAFSFDSSHDIQSEQIKRCMTGAIVFQQHPACSRISFVLRISGAFSGSTDIVDGWNIKLKLPDGSEAGNSAGYISKVKVLDSNSLNLHTLAIDYFPLLSADPACTDDLPAYNANSDFSRGITVSIQNASSGTLTINRYELNVVQHVN